MTKASVLAKVMNAQTYSPEPPKPLRRKTSKPAPYPVDALGEVLGEAAKAIQDKIQAPLAICCQSVLSVAALAAQAHADVRLPMGQTRPLSSFFVTVANSGERKTSSDNEAIIPILEREADLKAGYEVELASWQNKQEAYEKQRSFTLNDKKIKTAEARAEALQALGAPPPAPLFPMLICPEPTYEGMCKLLMHGQPTLGVFSSEGGQFIGGHGMTEDNRLKTAAAISNLWDGQPVKRVRAGDGATIMCGKRVSLHLMVQPGVAQKLLSDRTLADQGLLSRLLIAAPESTVGTRFFREVRMESTIALEQCRKRMRGLFQEPYPLAMGKTNELKPRTLELVPNARKVYVGFSDHVEAALGAGGALEPVRAFANKMPEHAVRLAGILALVENPYTNEINELHMDMGIKLVHYYASEALRLFDEGQISEDIELAGRLLHWLQHAWDEPLISLPNIYQSSLNAIGDKATASRLVRILEDHGWLIRQENGGVVRGEKRREVWLIVKEPKHEAVS